MNLAPHEIYQIEKYLLEQDLISLEFYNEMLDHFISSILDYKSKGNDFETAFILTRNAFKGVRNSNRGNLGWKTGIKALELKRIEAIEKTMKAEREWAPLNLLKSKYWPLAILSSIFFFVVSLFFGSLISILVVTIIVLVLSILMGYFATKAKIMLNDGSMGRWSRFMFSSLTKRKEIQLVPNFKLYIIFKSLIPFVVLIPLYVINIVWDIVGVLDKSNWRIELGLDFYTIKIITSYLFMIAIVDQFILFKKEYDKINLGKA